MRWDRLFDDLEAQWDAEEHRERDAEVADRTRRERATVPLLDRFVAQLSAEVRLRLLAGVEAVGVVDEVGDGWLLLDTRPGVLLVRLDGVRAWPNPSMRAAPSKRARRFGVGYALRGISRDRRAVVVTDVTGGMLEGTVEAVGEDHFDLSEHPADAPRRAEHVRSRVAVPFSAVVCVRVA
ncbi:hypothetical protein [Kribbia dieselivorans]|uniref:hypothetical protein n=1 Tax=Kribbia dieselivorans TaxID=331526 RepID=UPI00083926D4|nr:hypothetical protein [Kribbia dieselivorans]